MTTTTDHPQTNGQVERYNRTIVTRLCHYVATNQRDLDCFVKPSTYQYNTKVHQATNVTLFSFVLTAHPPRRTTCNNSSALATDVYHSAEPQTLQSQLLACIESLHTCVNKCPGLAQERYKRSYDKKVCSSARSNPGQLVHIDKPQLAASSAGSAVKLVMASYNKSMPRALEPFPSLRSNQIH